MTIASSRLPVLFPGFATLASPALPGQTFLDIMSSPAGRQTQRNLFCTPMLDDGQRTHASVSAPQSTTAPLPSLVRNFDALPLDFSFKAFLTKLASGSGAGGINACNDTGTPQAKLPPTTPTPKTGVPSVSTTLTATTACDALDAADQSRPMPRVASQPRQRPVGAAAASNGSTAKEVRPEPDRVPFTSTKDQPVPPVLAELPPEAQVPTRSSSSPASARVEDDDAALGIENDDDDEGERDRDEVERAATECQAAGSLPSISEDGAGFGALLDMAEPHAHNNDGAAVSARAQLLSASEHCGGSAGESVFTSDFDDPDTPVPVLASRLDVPVPARHASTQAQPAATEQAIPLALLDDTLLSTLARRPGSAGSGLGARPQPGSTGSTGGGDTGSVSRPSSGRPESARRKVPQRPESAGRRPESTAGSGGGTRSRPGNGSAVVIAPGGPPVMSRPTSLRNVTSQSSASSTVTST